MPVAEESSTALLNPSLTAVLPTLHGSLSGFTSLRGVATYVYAFEFSVCITDQVIFRSYYSTFYFYMNPLPGDIYSTNNWCDFWKVASGGAPEIFTLNVF